jgi:hypothetical protein
VVTTISQYGFAFAIFLAFLLGVIHGITPDEHTWPIVFSYSIGAGSTKGGMKAAILFSLSFAVQRGIMTELAYLGLAPIIIGLLNNGLVYLSVGLLMLVAGAVVLHRRTYLHLHILERIGDMAIHRGIGSHHPRLGEGMLSEKKQHPHIVGQAPLNMVIVHGFVAGFGFGAFALILLTILAPAMPNLYVAWLPGFAYGLGTLASVLIFGVAFGHFMQTRRFEHKDLEFIARNTSGRTLWYGGIAFMLVGLAYVFLPSLANFQIPTPIPIYNLNEIDIGFVLVIAVLLGAALPSYLLSVREVKAARANNA